MSDAVFPAPDGTRFVLAGAKQYDPKRCPHTNVEVDVELAHLHCSMCGAEMNPIVWIDQLRRNHVVWDHARREMARQRMRLEAKQTTRCQHCSKVTRVTEPKDSLQKYDPDAESAVEPSRGPRLSDPPAAVPESGE